MPRAPFRDNALDLAQVAPVLAVQARGKAPIGGRGVHDATQDPGRINELRASHPTANVGIACGHDDLVVLDFDPPNGGEDTLATLNEEVGLPPTVSVVTPGSGGVRGLHLYFRAGVRTRRLAHLGLDVQSAGVYVVGAGSFNSRGAYGWLNRPTDTQIADLPDDVEAWLAEQAPPPRRVDVDVDVDVDIKGVPAKVRGRRLKLPDRTWRLIRDGLATGEYPERDTLLGAVMMSMARAQWSFGQAVQVVLKPEYPVSEKLLGMSSAQRDRELERTWTGCVAQVVQLEALVAAGRGAISALGLPGRAGGTDIRVLLYLLEKAARDPARSGITITSGELSLEVTTTCRTLADDVEIRPTTAHASLGRLQEAGFLKRTVTGCYVGRTPSEYRMKIPIVGGVDVLSLQLIDPDCSTNN
ncbi:MAG: bifunctional DNA primase/polymerase [bacterium]|nr:bifunctional DNA primase/polymerase [bacterium]